MLNCEIDLSKSMEELHIHFKCMCDYLDNLFVYIKNKLS